MSEHRYHHGDLNHALRRAAAELMAEKGASGFSLREVARRAGVSHAAPAHHFGDATGLRTAVAIDAFEHLTLATQAAFDAHDDPAERLAAVGRAYVEVAVSHPGHCAVAFRTDLVDTDNDEWIAAGERAFGVLEASLSALAAALNPELDIALAAVTCWSAMQGLIELHGAMASRQAHHGLGELPPIGDLAEQVSRTLVDGFRLRTEPASRR